MDQCNHIWGKWALPGAAGWLLAFWVGLAGCGVSKPAATAAQAFNSMLYNVENLFDIHDDPKKADNNFMPGTRRDWTQKRYEKKLADLAYVISKIGEERPVALVGLSEVENRQVLKDLIRQLPVLKFGYQIIHEESPDERGIDVALLYMPGQFEPLHHQAITVTFPFDSTDKTRDILYVKGLFAQTDTLHVFVNHWPSRWGGKEASAPKRLYAASVLKKRVENIQSGNPAANIIIMGDINDDPNDHSMQHLTQISEGHNGPAPPRLVNLTAPLVNRSATGTFKYQGKWHFFDQFAVSANLLHGGSKLHVPKEEVKIYNPRWLLWEDKKYGGLRTNQTYGGTYYYGGYSDHLPVVMPLVVQP